MSSNKGWIGVDLDGTLANWDGWKGEDHIGDPIPLMVDRVKTWIAEGREVRIFTARVDGGTVALNAGDPNGVHFQNIERVKAVISSWLVTHIGVDLPITNVKDYAMIELWDDRAKQVIPNTGISVESLVNFTV